MTNTMLDVVTDARIGTGTGIVRDTTTNVMMDAGIDVVTAIVIEACSDFGVGIEGNDWYSD